MKRNHLVGIRVSAENWIAILLNDENGFNKFVREADTSILKIWNTMLTIKLFGGKTVAIWIAQTIECLSKCLRFC